MTAHTWNLMPRTLHTYDTPKGGVRALQSSLRRTYRTERTSWICSLRAFAPPRARHETRRPRGAGRFSGQSSAPSPRAVEFPDVILRSGRIGLFSRTSPLSAPPKALEAIGRQLGIAHRVLNVLVAEPGLQRPRVVAGIGQRIAAAMAQHVRMDRKRHLGASAVRPNSAWKAFGVIGPSRSVMKTCDDGPCSRCRRRRARISSPCIGWTLGDPFLALRTCSRPVDRST